MENPHPLTEMPGIPRADAGPVFRAPWEAQAFAIVLSLYERGAFGWKEWAEGLSEAIRDAQAAGDPDTGENYYQHWLTALERMVASKGILTESTLARRRAQWEETARRTPHGQPIELERD